MAIDAATRAQAVVSAMAILRTTQGQAMTDAEVARRISTRFTPATQFDAAGNIIWQSPLADPSNNIAWYGLVRQARSIEAAGHAIDVNQPPGNLPTDPSAIVYGSQYIYRALVHSVNEQGHVESSTVVEVPSNQALTHGELTDMAIELARRDNKSPRFHFTAQQAGQSFTVTIISAGHAPR